MCFSRNHLHPVGYGEHRGLGKPSGLCPAQDRHRGRPPLRARSGPSLPNFAPGIGSSGSVLSSSSSSSASACHDGQLSAEGVPIKVALLSPGLAFFFLYYWQAWTSLPFFLPLFWVIQLVDLKGAPLGPLYVSPGWL